MDKRLCRLTRYRALCRSDQGKHRRNNTSTMSAKQTMSEFKKNRTDRSKNSLL